MEKLIQYGTMEVSRIPTELFSPNLDYTDSVCHVSRSGNTDGINGTGYLALGLGFLRKIIALRISITVSVVLSVPMSMLVL